ncbi:MAG: 30S ribosomal protein S1 [Planctomycetaceae bacterium]|nr:30S ribosomal protein S1 [Planctomycetaceae bacterium]
MTTNGPSETSSTPQDQSTEQTASGTAGETQAVESQPAAAEPAETAAPSEVETASQAQEQSAPERKLELNPTLGNQRTEAVPNLGPGSSAQHVPDQGPVDIPSAEELDSELESQLAAAMAGDNATAQAASGTSGATVPGMPKDLSELEPGARLKGKVESVDEEQLVLDIGFRASGLLSRRHLEGQEVPAVGAVIDVIVESVNEGEGIIELAMPRSVRKAGGDWTALSAGQVVECTVEKTNKGGLSVVVSQLRGFMPAGQVDLHFVGDLEGYVGQKLTVKVIDINPKKKNLVVSRKALLQEERAESEKQIWETLSVGEQREGTVKSIMDYGAFVDIGGVDGLVHVRELSWTRVNHPSDVLTVGEQVTVKVLSLDQEKKKISLGMKQLLANPWDYAEQKYAQGTVVSGVVKKITEFGAFIEIEPGLEGLVHISELDHKRVNHVREVLQEGQTIDAKVIEINKNKRRISLSIKAIKAKPQLSPEQIAAREADAKEAQKFREEAEQRRKTLKGGTSSSSGGGLFGNPNDFK